MFDLYDIYDSSEIMIFILMIIIIILVIVIISWYSFGHIKEIEEEIEEIIHIPKSNNESTDYKKKYQELIKEKGNVDVNQVKYSPSEFSTLLKYNPILPYSAFTWDIINNSYLDFNEQSNQDDRYFSLNNYDNIYKSYNESDESDSNSNSNSNSNKGKQLTDTAKIDQLSDRIKQYKKNLKNNNGGSSNNSSNNSNNSNNNNNYNNNSNYEYKL